MIVQWYDEVIARWRDGMIAMLYRVTVMSLSRYNHHFIVKLRYRLFCACAIEKRNSVILYWFLIYNMLFIHYLTLFLFPNAHLQYNVYHDDAIKWRQTIARQRPNNDSIEHGVFSIKRLPHSYHTITLSLMTIAPSRHQFVVPSHCRAITSSSSRYRTTASS